MNTRITISLPTHLVEGAKAAVTAGAATSVSAYIADALEPKLSRQEMVALLDQWIEEDGGISKEDARWADEQIAMARAHWATQR